MSKRELKALRVELSEKRTGLRALFGREHARISLESSREMMEAEELQALKDRVAEFEGKLTDAIHDVKDKGTKMDAQVALLTTTREQLDHEQAKAECVRKEADELRSKVSSLERERDELKSRTESDTSGRESGLRETFVQAQTKMMITHAKTAAVQNFPPLTPFTGEEIDCEDKSLNFVKWHERFEESASLAGWDNEQKLYQLKFHLKKNALCLFEMLPESERKAYASAVEILKKRFRTIDIEELRGLEFNQKMQTSESVEQLDIDLMSLGRKAFPKICEAEFDRMLKGKFFQALLPLSAPKIDEKFNDLYDRARVAERHEKQYLASASARSDAKDKKIRGLSRAATSQEELQRKQIARVKAVPIVLRSIIPQAVGSCFGIMQVAQGARAVEQDNS